MTLSKFQIEKCLELVRKLMSWPICAPFIDPVDPEKHNALNYYEVIKTPMTLREVENRLMTKRYKDVSEFRRDVNLIWDNAITYNGDANIFGHFAMEGRTWFNEKMSHFPATQEEEWMCKMQKVIRRFCSVITNPPKELIPEKTVLTKHVSVNTNALESAIFDE